MALTTPTKEDIVLASDRLEKFLPRTPVLQSRDLSAAAKADLYFKMENLMPEVGCFKARGALNAMLKYQRQYNLSYARILTHSSGNHAQAVAWAAQKLGWSATIVMPKNANETKKRNVRQLGGQIIECEPGDAARYQMLECAKQDMRDAIVIPPFDDYDIIAGQATAAKELFEQVPNLDAVIAPVGGGGLLSGVAIAAYHFSPLTEVIGAEPAGADDAYRSMQSGRIEKNDTVNTIADGLVTTLGEKTFPIIKKHVDRIVVVDDEEIKVAMRMMWERLRAVVEPSGAVPFAAAMKENSPKQKRRIGIIVSGGNVDLDRIPFLQKGK